MVNFVILKRVNNMYIIDNMVRIQLDVFFSAAFLEWGTIGIIKAKLR